MFGRAAIWFAGTVAATLMSFAAVQGLPEGEGKRLIEDRCTMCHGVDLITDAKLNREAWKSTLQKMVDYGTKMDAKEVEIVADYLSKNFGAPSSADEKTALRYVEGICSSCHDSEIIATTEATKEEWLEIVNRMNGKGAGLSEQDIVLLTNYLAQKYPKK
jgi:cytochrome c5